MLKMNLQLFAVNYDKDMDVAIYLDSLNNGSEVDKHYRSEFAKSLGFEGNDSPEEVKAIADYLNRPKGDGNNQKSTGTNNTDGSSSHYMSQIKANTGIGVSQSARDAINTPFTASAAYQEAMNYTNQLLQQMSSGRTSYTDQINDLMGQIKNRDPFKYDVDSDMLFQQYLASSMASGKTAMQDAMGQAAALTGGYGSTYATAVGNQQYNAYIQDAYHNLPEYYQLALDAYEQEGQEMYDQLAMLNAADAQEYQRMYDAWRENYTSAQQMYENEYGAWQDTVANGYKSAALEMEEQAQNYDQAYKTYAAVKDYEDAEYEKLLGVLGDGKIDDKKMTEYKQEALKVYDTYGEANAVAYIQTLPDAYKEEVLNYVVSTSSMDGYKNSVYASSNDIPYAYREWAGIVGKYALDVDGNMIPVSELDAKTIEKIKEKQNTK